MHLQSSGPLSSKASNPTFWEWQKLRLQFRGLLLWEGVKACLFWVVFLSAAVRLAALGLKWTGALLFLTWFFFALPTLLIQAAVFADLFNYLFTRRVYLLRTFERKRKEQVESQEMALARIRLQQPFLYYYLRLAIMTAHTSPLTPLAIWAMLVLLRLPSKAHLPEDEPTAVLSLKSRLRDAETFLVERAMHRRAAAAP